MNASQGPELSNSWVVVPPEENKESSGVQDVHEHDSESDSISVISESGCSHKTDEEESLLADQDDIEEGADLEEEPPQVAEAEKERDELARMFPSLFDERVVLIATSTLCAIILVVFSASVQHYYGPPSHINKFEAEERDFSYLKGEEVGEKVDTKRKRQIMLNDIENKIPNRGEKKFLSFADDDLNVESKNRGNKNKKCNKENCDAKKSEGESCNKKAKELKIKEAYLREKEKFLIEKEHDLLKKEIKMKAGKNYAGDKEKKVNKKENGQAKDKVKQRKDKKADGDWYINMHEARHNMRQKKRYNYKMNKAHWYFQWMVDRARLRGK